MDEIIDTYHDRVRGVFERWTVLKADRAVVRCHFVLGPRVEQTVFLKDLKPQPIRQWARSRYFVWMLLAAIGFVPWTLLVVFSLLAFPREPTPQMWGSLLIAVPGILSVIALIRTWPYIEHFVLVNESGVVSLIVVRSGPDASHFDEFCTSLFAQVEFCRQPEQPSQSPSPP